MAKSINDNFLVIAVKFIVRNKWEVIKYLIFATLAIITFFGDGFDTEKLSWIDLSVIVGFIAWAIFSILSDDEKRKLKQELEKLKNVSEKLNAEEEYHFETKRMCKISVEELFNQFLNLLVKRELDFSASERISVYYHNKKKDEFRIIARYSEHPEFNRTNRFRFPTKQGCIYRAWIGAIGYHFKKALPNDQDEYLEVLVEDYNMDEEIVRELRMRSRFYFAQVIKNKATERIGVIVVESENKNCFELETLRSVFDRNNELLAEFIALNKRLDPIMAINLGDNG